jgi:hypothetical protein
VAVPADSFARAVSFAMSQPEDVDINESFTGRPGRNSEVGMSIATMQEPVAAPRLAATLLPIMGVVFVAFLVIGIAMPVLPLHVHDGLGLSTFVVGLVAGSQFAASLISRPWAGHYSDTRGAKRGVIAPAHSSVTSAGPCHEELDAFRRPGWSRVARAGPTS